MKAIGTVRENRTQEANKKLKYGKTIEKSTRGEFDYCNDGNVFFVKEMTIQLLALAAILGQIFQFIKQNVE